MTCSGVMLLPKMRTEPVMRRMSLKTPARVRTRPLPAPTRNTAAMLSRNATEALLSSIHGLRCRHGQYVPETARATDGRVPDFGDFQEGRHALREWQDGEVDERTDRGVVVQRDEGIHLEAMQKDLDHYQARRLKLRVSGSVGGSAQMARNSTHGDRSCLSNEADEVELELALRGKCDTARDHEDNDGEPLAWLLQLERPRDEEDRNWCECLVYIVREGWLRDIELCLTFSI